MERKTQERDNTQKRKENKRNIEYIDETWKVNENQIDIKKKGKDQGMNIFILFITRLPL